MIFRESEGRAGELDEAGGGGRGVRGAMASPRVSGGGEIVMLAVVGH